MVVVEPEGRVHAHVAVALVDVVEGEETGAHETRAGQQVLRVGLNLENKSTSRYEYCRLARPRRPGQRQEKNLLNPIIQRFGNRV